MDDVFLSPDIEEQIVQQLRAMARSKKLRLLRSMLNFLTKALPVFLAALVICALALNTYNQQRTSLSRNDTPEVQVSTSIEGNNRIVTTKTVHELHEPATQDSNLFERALRKLHLR